MSKLVSMVAIPKGKWTLLLSRGKGHLLKIGPFEEWVPRRVVEITEEGVLYISAAYLTPGRLWSSILKSYPVVKRPADETAMGMRPGAWDDDDDDEDDDDDIEVKVSAVTPRSAPAPAPQAAPTPAKSAKFGATVKKKPLKHAARKAKQVGKRRQATPKPAPTPDPPADTSS